MQNFGNTEYSTDIKIQGLLFRSLPTFCIMDKLRREGKMISTKIYWISDKKKPDKKSSSATSALPGVIVAFAGRISQNKYFNCSK